MDAPARVRAAERHTRCIAAGRTGCPEGAGWSAFFPPEAERFLGRPVGVAEDRAIGFRGEPVAFPGRHYEDVFRCEFEMGFADRDAALPFGDAEHRAVGAAVFAAGESARQP